LKKLTITILVLSIVLLAGCVRPAVNTKALPLAYIDSVSSSEIYAGDMIKFSGHGVPAVGQLVAYQWRSSVNGHLSSLATFETKTLTAGPHSVWFQVQDSYGNWSQEVSTNVNVLVKGAPTTMSIRVFSASPPSIKQGEWAALSWDVSGLGTVTVEPGIGDVSASGNRSVQPLQTTVYTIYGKNDQGIVKSTTQVSVSPVPLYSLTVYSIEAEEGTIRGNDVTFGQVLIGQDQLQKSMQGFLSFDVSSLPPDAVIKGVQIDLTRSTIFNTPFPYLGSLQILNQQYGLRYDQDRNIVNLSALPLFSWSYGYAATQMPTTPFTSPEFVKALQGEVDTGGKRFQVKLQFEKYYYYPFPNYSDTKYQLNRRDANYIDVGSGNPSLIVLYTLPEGAKPPPGAKLVGQPGGN
jgi:hypothetical protein